jgi:hypothetical protein
VQQLGGVVAPRTNWSSPSDALWLSADNSLACRNADEVCLPVVPCLSVRLSECCARCVCVCVNGCRA